MAPTSTIVVADDEGQAFGVVDRHQRVVTRSEGGIKVRDAPDLGVRVLLEEQVAGDALRRPHQRHGAVLEVGQDPVRDALVEMHQVDFAQTGGRIDDVVGIADPHRRTRLSCRFGSRRCRRRGGLLSPDRLGILVRANTAEGRMAHMAVRRPLAEGSAFRP